MLKVAWGSHPKVGKDFTIAVIQVCVDLGWKHEQASHLLSCMAFETGESFSATVRNAAGSGAVGLIQFMPNTARGLGTTVEYLAQLQPIYQLEYVKRYFKPYANRIKSLSDMYMAILMPKYIGAPEDTQVFTNGIMYNQNAGLDRDKDHVVTKAEITALVQAKLDKGMRDVYALELPL